MRGSIPEAPWRLECRLASHAADLALFFVRLLRQGLNRPVRSNYERAFTVHRESSNSQIVSGATFRKPFAGSRSVEFDATRTRPARNATARGCP